MFEQVTDPGIPVAPFDFSQVWVGVKLLITGVGAPIFKSLVTIFKVTMFCNIRNWYIYK